METKVRRIELKQSDYKLLLHLQENPMINYSKLAFKLNKPVKTISDWISKLEEANFLRQPKAILNYKRLELEIFDVLVQADEIDTLKLLELLCYEHPYTTYRSRINGAINGLYVQFQAPNGSLNFFNDLFNEVRKIKPINYEIFHSDSQSFSSTFNLDFWDQIKYDWNFEWNEWQSQLGKLEKQNTNYPRKKEKDDSKLKELAIEDIFILAKLTTNAKIKQTTLIKELEREGFPPIPPQRISERIKFLKDNFVHEYRLYLDWTVLNLYTTLLFHVKCSDSFSMRIAKLMEDHPPPFPGNFRKYQNGFLWYLSLAPSHFSKVASLLWNPQVQSFHVNFLDYSNSMTYYLYYKTFDEKKKSWIQNSDFIVKDPISRAKEQFKVFS